MSLNMGFVCLQTCIQGKFKTVVAQGVNKFRKIIYAWIQAWCKARLALINNEQVEALNYYKKAFSSAPN